MIKHIALNSNGITCYRDDGSILNISSACGPNPASIQEMIKNIQVNGFTHLIGLPTEGLAEIIKGLGFDVVGSSREPRIVTETGEVSVAPIADLITHANANNQPEPITALLNRIINIDRNHSRDDLVKFLERARMPVTNDGRIVAFKRVTKLNGTNYDVHSKSVVNEPLTRVYMDIGDVDPDRSNDCSYGLHVASRDYLTRFGGEVLLLILINPEDVIAVPEYDPRKVRVCAYDIVHEFSPEDTLNVLSYDELSDSVWSIIRQHIEGVKYTLTGSVKALSGKGCEVSSSSIEAGHEGTAVCDEYLTPVSKTDDAKKVDMKEVVKQVKDLKQGNTFTNLYNLWDVESSWTHKKSRFMDLMEFKRRQKKSWKTLGANENQEKELKKFEERIK